MPRPARHLLIPQAPVCIHYIWRCHNRDFLLNNDDTKHLYLKLLHKYKKRFGIKIYGYTIMDSHFHAVMKVPSRTDWELFSRCVNSAIARFINRRSGRCGQVVMDRPRTIVLQSDKQVLATLRYIDMNPVRAGIVKRLKDFRWSSYRHHAFGSTDALIDPCPSVDALGKSSVQRRKAYVGLFWGVYREQNLQRRAEMVDVYFLGEAHWQLRQQGRLREARAQRGSPAG